MSMIIKTLKEPIEKVFSVIYTVGLNRFKIGTENSYYEFSLDSIDKLQHALKAVNRQKCNWKHGKRNPLFDNKEDLERYLQRNKKTLTEEG